MTRTLRHLFAGVAFAAALIALPVFAQQTAGVLFPAAFVVEHGVVQTDADGTVFATEPVTDYYGGSWIVSERADSSRLVVDFVRREITEIRPEAASYTVIGFDRMAGLLRELQAIEGGGAPAAKAAVADSDDEGPRLRVVEAKVGEGSHLKRASQANPLIERPGVRHLQVLRDDPRTGRTATVLDAWFDPQIRFGRTALEALDGFEAEVLGATTGDLKSSPAAALALARGEANGAVPILTVRSLSSDADGAGSVEDSARRIEALDAFPVDLVSVPEGFRRTPHPLELMVAHAEREAELRRLMGGGSGR